MMRILLLTLLLAPITLWAQFNYVLDQNAIVKGLDGDTLTMPWAGGLNAAEYNSLDVNGDGKNDLVVFDRMADKVITFINENNQYKYAPAYESLFPEDITNWMLLRDFNCDGKNDIFASDRLGIKVYLNTTVADENLSWERFLFYTGPSEPKSDVLMTKVNVDLINLLPQYDDLPSINDMDGDGDLDIISTKASGGTIEYHKNLSKELYDGACDSLAFERVTDAWGNFKECECGSFAFNDDNCPSTSASGRVQHVGGKTLLAIDVDGDEDLDLLLSESSCNDTYLLTNTGNKTDAVISASDNFPQNNPIDFYISPATYYEDVDFDGKKDLIASPYIYTKEDLNSKLASSNWLYKNTGSTQSPIFNLTKTNFLQGEMIDVGDNSVPAFADYDNDGDFDLFISQNTSEEIASAISVYKNIGTAYVPEFELTTKDYLSFSQLQIYNLKIHFADINGDAKIDLVFTTTVSNGGTGILYVLNKSTGSFNFSGQEIKFINVSLSYKENICLVDVELDGYVDLLIGRDDGSLEYWKNDGALNFSKQSTPLLGLGVSTLPRNFACAVADLDADTNEDLILTDQSGLLRIVSDFRKASDGAGSISEIVFNPITENYLSQNLGGRLWPTVVNLYNTDKPAIVVGNILGGIQILRNDKGIPVLGEVPVIDIYPNPVAQSEYVHIKVDRDGFMQIYSPLGQRITDSIALTANEVKTYSVQSFAKGLYLIKFTFNGKSYTKRMVVY